MKWALGITGLAVITAIAAAVLFAVRPESPPPYKPILVDEFAAAARAERAAAEAARTAVKGILRDPESARFRKMAIATGMLDNGKTNEITCGYVNAKNAYGGYTGDQPWYVIKLWDGSTTVCINKLGDCDYIALAGLKEANACRESLGP